MTVAFTADAWEHYIFWQENDSQVLDKINELIKDINRDPFRGLGKPEPLKGDLTGYWSRRITGEHRLVYRVQGIKPEQLVVVIHARFHYQ